MNHYPFPHEVIGPVIHQDITTRRRPRPTEESTPLTPLASRPPGWRARAVDEFAGLVPTRRAGLKAQFVDRLLALTGHSISPKNVYVDDGGRMAITKHDGTIFRLDSRGRLVLLRPCSYCGTGQFESPEIDKSESLGYALAEWAPRHPDCGAGSTDDAAGLSA